MNEEGSENVLEKLTSLSNVGVIDLPYMPAYIDYVCIRYLIIILVLYNITFQFRAYSVKNVII